VETPPSHGPWTPLDAGRLHFLVRTLNDPSAGKEVREEVPVADANLVSSLLPGGAHAPALDVDTAVHVVPSTTPGHFHLYLERPTTWRAYRRLLRAMWRAGYLEEAVYWRSLDRGATFLRLPWVRKTADEASHGSQDRAADQKAADRAMRIIRARVRLKRAAWWLTGT